MKEFSLNDIIVITDWVCDISETKEVLGIDGSFLLVDGNGHGFYVNDIIVNDFDKRGLEINYLKISSNERYCWVHKDRVTSALQLIINQIKKEIK